MPSSATIRWRTTRRNEIKEIINAHSAIGGSGPGRRFATQQINRVYAVLLAAQFQGFCRDLHTECADHLTSAIEPASLRGIFHEQLTRNRQLNRSNAHSASIAADFSRFGLKFMVAVDKSSSQNKARRNRLDELNLWRNAIVHQDFEKLGGKNQTLSLEKVKGWNSALNNLARTFDTVMRDQLLVLTSVSPW